jgi:hypothetical protein
MRINPFDPEPHCGLAEASDRPDERNRERESCRQLGGSVDR